MIYVANINKTYGSVTALTDVNLEFNSQGFYAVVGPSGCGKSVLLKIIGSLEAPSSGKMIVNTEEHDFSSTRAIDSYRRHFVSYVFQDNNLIETLSVYDNLYICMNTVNTDSHKINLKIERELIDLDILELKYKKVKDLSIDEKQRVTIARAALCHAKLIIADEPTNYLSASNERIILDKLKKISENTLVIVGTRKVNLANQYADYMIKLKDSIVIDQVKKNDLNESLKLIPPMTHSMQYRFSNYIKIAMNELVDKKDKYMIIVLGLIIGIFGIFLGLASTGLGALNSNQNQDMALVEQAFETSQEVLNLALIASIILLFTIMILIYSVIKDVLIDNENRVNVLRSLGYSKNAIYIIYDIQHFILAIISAMILTFLIIVFLMINYLFLQVAGAKLIFDWSYLILAYALIFNIPLLFSLLPVFKIPKDLLIS